jgi:hypothetical protein
MSIILNKSVSSYKQRHNGTIWQIDIYEYIKIFLDGDDRLNLCIAHQPCGLIDYRPDPDKYNNKDDYRPNV